MDYLDRSKRRKGDPASLSFSRLLSGVEVLRIGVFSGVSPEKAHVASTVRAGLIREVV